MFDDLRAAQMSEPVNDTSKLLLGLAAAVGTALVVFARKHGVEIEPEPEPRLSDPREVKRALLELQQWSGMKETDPRAAPLLAKYWAAAGLPPQPVSTPWSAAFISYVAAGAVQPSASHIGYARAAWRARQARLPGRYWAFQPQELGALRRGDILIKARGGPVTWADVIADTGHKDTHGDLLIDDGSTLVGGNVSDTVRTSPLVPGSAFAVLRKMDEGAPLV